jgi:SAM-dependent methyltransferase
VSTAPDAGYSPAYTLDNTWSAAQERLRSLELCLDPLTEQYLDQLGVGPGWHCLEVGAGAGSVVRLLCDRVGADGRVLAVDLEPGLLGGLTAENLAVQRLDVVTDALPEAEFDLIHTRAVLLHIPQRHDVLRKLVRALRPGGVLLLEEMDVEPAFAVPESIFRRTIEVAWHQINAAGGDIFWGTKMRAALQDAGLVEVDEARVPTTFTGGSTLAEFHRLTLLQLLESKHFSQAERAIVEAGLAALAEPGGDYLAWHMVAAWGRRP